MRGCPRRLDGRSSPPAEVAEKKRCQPPNLGRCGPRSPRKADPNIDVERGPHVAVGRERMSPDHEVLNALVAQESQHLDEMLIHPVSPRSSPRRSWWLPTRVRFFATGRGANSQRLARAPRRGPSTRTMSSDRCRRQESLSSCRKYTLVEVRRRCQPPNLGNLPLATCPSYLDLVAGTFFSQLSFGPARAYSAPGTVAERETKMAGIEDVESPFSGSGSSGRNIGEKPF